MRKLVFSCVALLLLPAVAPAQEVFKDLSTQRMEKILTDMGISFKKLDGGKNTYFYDYTSKSLLLRITYFDGKDIMVDAYLQAVKWEEVNRWNMTAKFSRAHIRKDAKNLDTVVLEANLDILGGVTEDTIKHFIRQFDLEIVNFSNFSKGGVVGAAEEIYTKISSDKLEGILNSLPVKFKKGKGQGPNDFYYDYTNKDGFEMRLTSFGGEDLMIDAIFAATTLAKLNAWNFKRHYIRATLYQGGGKPYTALEANIDCVGGVSDSIVRYFVTVFDAEVKDFSKYLMGK